jgi:hypothetical protein
MFVILLFYRKVCRKKKKTRNSFQLSSLKEDIFNMCGLNSVRGLDLDKVLEENHSTRRKKDIK